MARYVPFGFWKSGGILLILAGLWGWAGEVRPALAAPREVIDPQEAAKDPDFAFQGEYLGEGQPAKGKPEKVGAQVIALGGGKFQAVIYRGGLPGEGWRRGDERFTMDGQRQGNLVRLEGRKMQGTIADGKLTIQSSEGAGKMLLQRIERKSPTLGAKPPAGARVIFDGTSEEGIVEKGHLTPMQTLLAGFTTKEKFQDYTLHLEFRLSWMPEARGQARSNSGVYVHDCYEIQVLDSFGLEGEHNECGGIYSIRRPDVNMCLPPMQWQTYDIEFTAPRYDATGKKVANARLTVRHNGVVIHDNLELDKGTPGRAPEGPGPRPIHFQGHGNKVQYRNIWLVPK
ncbi:MAG: DUF1080 domain-containing protein [Thermoguttaceae bacterium]|nr:DUF1080 domain-containing protein [Thermoguttaceae bacterium]MDW8038774.1 DUF1080 domain-containing protein [Thermoguttaceae bacterium]